MTGSFNGAPNLHTIEDIRTGVRMSRLVVIFYTFVVLNLE